MLSISDAVTVPLLPQKFGCAQSASVVMGTPSVRDRDAIRIRGRAGDNTDAVPLVALGKHSPAAYETEHIAAHGGLSFVCPTIPVNEPAPIPFSIPSKLHRRV